MSGSGHEETPRIVDAVYAVAGPERAAWPVLALALAASAHLAIWLWARGSEKSLESWSAELALRVHQELSREELVTMPQAKPPPPPAPPREAPPPAPTVRVPERQSARERSPAPAPAQAGAIVAREADPNAPVDLTADTFVTGSADAYAGGVTTARGTNTTAVRALAPAPTAKATAPRSAAPDHSMPVTLADQEWNCPWPREAEAEPVDEQRVVLKVNVRADGAAASAQVLQDPGHGFAQAAIACALRTRFTPARDHDGRAIEATSPAIRVRFTR